MTLPPDWSEFIDLLFVHQVRFLIVGAHAVAANGRPRATQDLDVWIEPTPPNAMRLCRALDAFGFKDLKDAAEEFAKPDQLATLGNPPLRIDIMTSIDGVGFLEAWDDRLDGSFGQYTVSFLGRKTLIRNKRASAGPKTYSISRCSKKVLRSTTLRWPAALATFSSPQTGSQRRSRVGATYVSRSRRACLLRTRAAIFRREAHRVVLEVRRPGC